MKYLNLKLLSIVIILCSAAKERTLSTTPSLIERKLINGSVKILLPASFNQMSADMLAAKYPSSQRPTLVYTNEGGSINFAFNHTVNEVKEKQLPEILPIFTQQFSNLYPQIQWLKKELVTVNGKSFIVMEFITPAADTRIYNLMYISELDGKMLMCSFNCMENQKAEWEPIAKQCLNSVKIK